MTETPLLDGAAPYTAADAGEDEDRLSAEAFAKLASGLRRTAVALAAMADGRGLAELREATVGLIEAAEGAEVVADIIGQYADDDTTHDDTEGTPE